MPSASYPESTCMDDLLHVHVDRDTISFHWRDARDSNCKVHCAGSTAGGESLRKGEYVLSLAGVN